MRGRSAVVAAWAMRVVRGLWPDHNPLRRTIDRAEAVVVVGLAAAFLAGVPLAAVAAGHYAYGYASRTAAAQRAALASGACQAADRRPRIRVWG
jgi:hypothetical protein